jgi:hypothetical protein
MTVAVAGAAALEHCWRELHEFDNTDLIPGRCPKTFRTILQRIRATLPQSKARTTFFFNGLTALWAILLLQSGRRSLQTRRASIPLTAPLDVPPDRRAPRTLDLSLILFVRALDVGFRALLFKYAERAVEDEIDERAERKHKVREKARKIANFADTLLFGAASGRIMFCFVYYPLR